MLFVEFVVQFIHFLAGLFEGAFPGRRNFVDPSAAAFHMIERGAQQARFFQPVQERIKSSGANAVAVVREFLHHGESEDGLVHGMQQHVDADETVEEFALLIWHKNKYTSTQVSQS